MVVLVVEGCVAHTGVLASAGVQPSLDLAAHLDKLATRLHTPTTPANFQVLHGTSSSSITCFAEHLPAALITMATHGRSGLTRLTLGSVANDVVRHAPCPILVTRPTDAHAGIDRQDRTTAEGDEDG